MSHRISVIIPTLNRFDDLQQFTRTLIKQTLLPEELVIVDAGTLDTIEPMLLQELGDSGIALTYLRADPGTSHQRNKGIEVAKGDYFFFFDDDVLLEPDYIEESMRCFDNDKEQNPPLGGVMGTFLESHYHSTMRRKYYHLFNITHQTDDLPPRILASGSSRWAVNPDTTIPVPACGGGRVVFRAECFKDELWDCFLAGYTSSEDVEISFRIAKKWRLVQTPKARLHHKTSPVSRNKYGEQSARKMYARFYFFRKHMPKDVKHVSAFAWYMLGATLLYSAGSIRQADEHTFNGLKGVAKAYRLCLRDLMQ
jgi:GT2 family glycosyltransferase